MDSRSDALGSNPACAIFEFFSLEIEETWNFHEQFIKQKFQET